MSVPMVKIGQILFPGNKYRLLAPEAAEELDQDGGAVQLTELELLEFMGHGRSRGVGVFKRENGELVEIPAYAFDPRPAAAISKIQSMRPPVKKGRKGEKSQITATPRQKKKKNSL